MKLVTTEFKSGGLHEKHVVATWNLGNRLCENKVFLKSLYFLGAFAKLRKATVTFVMFVRLSFLVEQFGFH